MDIQYIFISVCGLLGLLLTSGENVMSVAPLEIYSLRRSSVIQGEHRSRLEMSESLSVSVFFPSGFHKVMEGIDKAVEMGYSPVKVVFHSSLLCLYFT